MPPTVEEWSLNHWTAREAPRVLSQDRDGQGGTVETVGLGG